MGPLDWMPLQRTRLATIEDINIYNEDIESLLPGYWLNDNIITFMMEYQLHHLSPEERRRIHIVHAPICEAIKTCQDESMARVFFDGVNLNDKDLVIFVVNNNLDAGREYGGSHWALLVWLPEFQMFVYLDSLYTNYSALHCAHKIVSVMLISGLIVAHSPETVIGKCAKQRNNSDCGMFVVEFARILMQNGYGDSSFRSVDPSTMTERRLHWIATIRSLYDMETKQRR